MGAGLTGSHGASKTKHPALFQPPRKALTNAATSLKGRLSLGKPMPVSARKWTRVRISKRQPAGICAHGLRPQLKAAKNKAAGNRV